MSTETKELAVISPEMFKWETTPAKVSFNFTEAREIVVAVLAERKTLVTPETIQGGKDLAANLSKTAKALMAAWKDRRLVSMEEILLTDEQIKDICSLLENGAVEIRDQVKAIEKETKDICEKLLIAYRAETWEDLGVETEFRNADLQNLVNLGSLNKNNELTPKTIKELVNRCKLDKASQTQVQMRVSELQVRCHNAGINPVLERRDIEHFIFWGDEMFYEALDKLINVQIERMAEAERIMREKIEKEQEAKKQKEIADALAAQQAEANRLAEIKADEERAELEAKMRETAAGLERMRKLQELQDKQEGVVEVAEQPKVEQPKEEQTPSPEGSVMFTVTVNFKSKVYPFMSKPGTDKEKMKAYFRRRAMTDGITEADIIDVEVTTNG